jgi:hypothetical protein
MTDTAHRGNDQAAAPDRLLRLPLNTPSRFKITCADLSPSARLVWEGDRPANDVAPAAEFERLYDRYIESDELVEPTARIVAYVTALLAGIRTSEQTPARAARGPPARGSSLPWTHAHAAGPSRPTVTEIRELVLRPCRIGCT